MSKRKTKETLGYDPLSKMVPPADLPPMFEPVESSSHDISFIQLIDNLLVTETPSGDALEDRATKGRIAQAEVLKKLNNKKENTNLKLAYTPPDRAKQPLELSHIYADILSPVLVVDKDWRVVSSNRQARAWFDIDDNALLAEPVHALFKSRLGEAYDLGDNFKLPLFKSFSSADCVIELNVLRLPYRDQSGGEFLFQWRDNTALEKNQTKKAEREVLLARLNTRLEQQAAEFAKASAALSLSNSAELDGLALAHEREKKQQRDALFGLFRLAFKKIEESDFDSPTEATDYSPELSEFIAYSNDFIARLEAHQLPEIITPPAESLNGNDHAYRRSELVIEKMTRILIELQADSLSAQGDSAAVVSGLRERLSGHDQPLAALNGKMKMLTPLAENLSLSCDEYSALLAMGKQNFDEIKDSSCAIHDMTDVINELAFQTNMLALNAAVEAARAGEEGRGFAIIASEVKRLSKKTNTIAKDVRSILLKNDANLKKGEKFFRQSDSSMTQIKSASISLDDEFVKAKQLTKKTVLGVDSLSQYVNDMDRVNNDNTDLKNKLHHLISKLQRYMDDVSNR